MADNQQLESTVAESAEIDDEDSTKEDSDDEEADDDEEEEEEEESEAESEDDEEELGAVDPAFRARVAAALQVSGMDVDGDAEDDDDESDDEVWDDEQMMKVDAQLAAVFKERAGAGKKVEKSEPSRYYVTSAEADTC